MQLPPFPTHFQIQTTIGCGADCSICPHPVESPKWTNGMMSDELFERIIDQLCGREIEYLSPYLMADPMSDRKIFQRVRQIRDVLPQTLIEISTTGKYLVPKLTDQLLESPLTELRISSHGISAKEYAQTMPGVNFEKAMLNILRYIERWRESKPYKLSVVCLWGLWPREREEEIVAFWTDLGVELSRWRVISRADQVNLTVFGDGSDDPTPYSRARLDPPYLCRSHRDTQWMHILSDGRVALCCMDYKHEQILGNVREATIEEIWSSMPYQTVRAQIRGDAPAEHDFLCSRCEWHCSRSVYDREEASADAAQGMTIAAI
jgi:radical SAM protein with 4Fe4S-binding SPASM domain